MDADDLGIASRIERAVRHVDPADRLDEIRMQTGQTTTHRRRGLLAAAAVLVIVVGAFVAARAGDRAESVRTDRVGDGARNGVPCPVATAPDHAPSSSTVGRSWFDALGVPEGYRAPVGSEVGGRTGWVNWEVLAGRTQTTPKVNPIYEQGGPSGDRGTIVGYWGTGIGWITPAEYRDPSFEYDEALAKAEARAAAGSRTECASAASADTAGDAPTTTR